MSGIDAVYAGFVLLLLDKKNGSAAAFCIYA